MGLLSAAEKTQVRVNVALDMIDQSEDPLTVRFAVAYAVGYVDALHAERLISLDGAQLYRDDAYERRETRLALLLERDATLEADIQAIEDDMRHERD